MLIGYARVSTLDQDTRLQMDALSAAGVGTVYSEKGSSTGARPELQRCLASLKEGDVLVVWKLDRIARSLGDLLGILARLKAKKIGLRSLTEPIDTSSAIGEFMVQVLGAVAQLEKAMIRERVIAGQVAAIVRGASHGRPKMLNPEQISTVLDMRRSGMTKPAIAKLFNVSRGVVDRIVAQADNPTQGRYAPQRHVLGPLLEAQVAMRSE